MENTSLGFKKPTENEYYDIGTVNHNTQLANDLIEGNTSAIGQKLDKESSFYADLEAYYGNTKLIDDFQDISKWTQWIGIQSADTTNVKIGSQSLKISENDNLAGQTYSVKFNTNVDLSSLNNGEISTDDDYVYLVCYISDVGKINASEGIQLLLSQAPDATTANCKNMNFTSGLVTGWNFLKAKKSDFITNGTGKWTDIQSIRIRWYSLANAQNAYVSFQLIQLVKADPDTLLDKPNPFQKFSIKEFDINSGEWFIGKEFDKLVVKCINKEGDYNKNSLIGTKKFSDFIMNVERITVNPVTDAYTCWYVNNDNFVEFFISAVTQKVTIRKTINGVTEVIAEVNTPNKSSELDVVTWTIHKQGSSLNVELKIENKNKLALMVEDIGILGSGVMSFGNSGTPKGDYYLSASITEISHTYHTDIAEVAKRLEYRNLKVPSIDLNDYVLKTMYIPLSAVGTAKYEVEIDLGSRINSGTLKVILASSWSTGNASGSIEKTIDINASGTSLVYQKSRYTYVSEDTTAKHFMISDIYISNGRKKIKIVKNTGTANSLSLILIGIGGWGELQNSIAGTPIESTETFVPPSMAPTETVITSGFAPGWTGTIKLSKTQEGLPIVNIVNLQKTSDISTTGEPVFTIGTFFRFSNFQRATVIGLNSSAVKIANSLVDIGIGQDGAITLINFGGVTTNVRRIAGIQLIGI